MNFHKQRLKRELKMGDKIDVRVTEIEKAHPLTARRPSDREDMKNRYYALKQELEDKGLI